MKSILGKKLEMTQIFTAEGNVIPVTVIKAGPCIVLQKKDKENDGYEAVQIGYADKKEKRMIKSEMGHAKKANTVPKRYVKEFRGIELPQYEVGQELKADLFVEGEYVDITGLSKGKGFAGVIKRWGQSRGPMSHGSRYHRGPGSMGSIQANRVPKGKRLPGRMGNDKITIQNLEIIKIDKEQNLMIVKGSIPGAKNSFIHIKSAIKK